MWGEKVGKERRREMRGEARGGGAQGREGSAHLKSDREKIIRANMSPKIVSASATPLPLRRQLDSPTTTCYKRKSYQNFVGVGDAAGLEGNEGRGQADGLSKTLHRLPQSPLSCRRG